MKARSKNFKIKRKTNVAEFTNLISEVHKTEISPNSSTSKPSRQIGIASNIA